MRSTANFGIGSQRASISRTETTIPDLQSSIASIEVRRAQELSIRRSIRHVVAGRDLRA
jgi:hypothetical protein